MVTVIINGFFRPTISLNGSKTSCPSASPIRHDVMLNCASEAVETKSSATVGKDGKYMSIDKGPNAVNNPRIMTIQILL